MNPRQDTMSGGITLEEMRNISANVDFSSDIGNVIDIGGMSEISIGDAVKVIATVMGHSDAVFEQLPSMPGSVANRRPDITKLRSIMPDYNPMSFEEGLRTTVKWFMDHKVINYDIQFGGN